MQACRSLYELIRAYRQELICRRIGGASSHIYTFITVHAPTGHVPGQSRRPWIHVTQSRDQPKVHVTQSRDQPKVHVTQSRDQPKVHVTQSRDQPKVHVTQSRDQPTVHVTQSRDQPKVHVTQSRDQPKVHVTQSRDQPTVHVTSVTSLRCDGRLDLRRDTRPWHTVQPARHTRRYTWPARQAYQGPCHARPSAH
jgi:hypothetical protein